MPRSTFLPLIVLLAAGACSKPAADGLAHLSTRADAAVAVAGNACDRKLLTAADVAPLLAEPIATVKAIPGDPQSCEFTTANFSSVQVALRPGLGHMTLDAVISGKTNQSVTPLAGVGERAVWDPILKEVDAEKNGLLCDIGAQGPATGGATKEKVGALCAKVFAAS